MQEGEDGKPKCTVHNKTDRGCHMFPWHPIQLINTERDDLPRIPVYQRGKTLYYGRNEGLGDVAFVYWAPLGEVCKYAFIDVTDELTENQRKKVKSVEDPRVHFTKPSWMRDAG
jgi:hypothetical protein